MGPLAASHRAECGQSHECPDPSTALEIPLDGSILEGCICEHPVPHMGPGGPT